MIIYKVWDITEEEKLLLETIDKQEMDKMLKSLRGKMLDPITIIKVQQITTRDTEDFFD